MPAIRDGVAAGWMIRGTRSRLDGVQEPPPPPPRLVEMTWVVGVGTALWALAGAGLLVAHLHYGRPLDDWFGACLAGTTLGLVGYTLFRLQRRAARRGDRGAQRGLD